LVIFKILKKPGPGPSVKKPGFRVFRVFEVLARKTRPGSTWKKKARIPGPSKWKCRALFYIPRFSLNERM